MTITEFLNARYDEEERAAREALDIGSIHTRESADVKLTWRWSLLVDYYSGGGYSSSFHPGAPTPEHVLADVAAKRAIVAWCSERDKVQINAGDPSDPQNYIDGEYSHGPDSVVLRLLAQPFAEHADFDPAWRT